MRGSTMNEMSVQRHDHHHYPRTSIRLAVSFRNRSDENKRWQLAYPGAKATDRPNKALPSAQ